MFGAFGFRSSLAVFINDLAGHAHGLFDWQIQVPARPRNQKFVPKANCVMGVCDRYWRA